MRLCIAFVQSVQQQRAERQRQMEEDDAEMAAILAQIATPRDGSRMKPTATVPSAPTAAPSAGRGTGRARAGAVVANHAAVGGAGASRGSKAPASAATASGASATSGRGAGPAVRRPPSATRASGGGDGGMGVAGAAFHAATALSGASGSTAPKASPRTLPTNGNPAGSGVSAVRRLSSSRINAGVASGGGAVDTKPVRPSGSATKRSGAMSGSSSGAGRK